MTKCQSYTKTLTKEIQNTRNKEEILKTAREEKKELTCKEVMIRMAASQLQHWKLEDSGFLDNVKNLTNDSSQSRSPYLAKLSIIKCERRVPFEIRVFYASKVSKKWNLPISHKRATSPRQNLVCSEGNPGWGERSPRDHRQQVWTLVWTGAGRKQVSTREPSQEKKKKSGPSRSWST